MEFNRHACSWCEYRLLALRLDVAAPGSPLSIHDERHCRTQRLAFSYANGDSAADVVGLSAVTALPKLLRWLLLGGFAVALLLLIWGTVIEPRLIIKEEEIARIPHLPPGWDGQRIALIADPQVGLWLSNTGTVRRVVSRLVEMRPAAVFIAGDFVYEPLESEGAQQREEQSESGAHRQHAVDETKRVTELLRPLTDAGIPTYAVLGNHDYAVGTPTTSQMTRRAKLVRDALEAMGIHVLMNEAIKLPHPGGAQATEPSQQNLWLVALGAHVPGKDHARQALAQVPDNAPRIVLMHNPDSFAKLPAGSAPLALAGHTHGGQIRLPWLLLRRILGRVNKERPQMSGWIEDYGQPGNRLYINRGIGFSRLPIRFNAPPEITIFTLRSAPLGTH